MQRLVEPRKTALALHRLGLQHLAAQASGRRCLKVDVQAGATAR
jgi:hypothetical protein